MRLKLLPSRPRVQTRQNFGVVELDGLIYVLGGENEVTELTTVEVFDPHFNTWKPQTSMTMVRSVRRRRPARPGTDGALSPPLSRLCVGDRVLLSSRWAATPP